MRWDLTGFCDNLIRGWMWADRKVFYYDIDKVFRASSHLSPCRCVSSVRCPCVQLRGASNSCNLDRMMRMFALAATLTASASAMPTVVWPHEMKESLDLGANIPEPVPVRLLLLAWCTHFTRLLT